MAQWLMLSSPSPNLPDSPLSASASPEDLAAIRARIDRLDDAIHDLLLARAELVAGLAQSGAKRGTPFRPAREAQILRRLLARHHGPLAKTTLVGVWHELLVGMTRIQAPFSVAVWSPAPGAGYVALAREQFGSATPVRWLRSAPQVLHAVASGDVSVGVLPLPEDVAEAEGGAEPWWTSLLHGETSGLSVVCRLPFVTLRPEGAPTVSALVVAALAPEPSGEDRSLIGFEGPSSMSRAALADLVVVSGFTVHRLVTRRRDPGPVSCLAEVDGLVSPEDPRLTRLARAGAARLCVLGAWPVPPPDSAFAPSPQDAAK